MMKGMILIMSNYENMSIDELKKKLHELNRDVTFRKPRIGKDGSILLNENYPEDIEWYEED